MKKCIRILALILALSCAAVLLTACGDSDKTVSDTESSAVSEKSESASKSAGTALKTAKEGYLTMATNAYFQPYEFYEGDKIVGIDAEIAEAIAKKLGLKLQITDIAFPSIITEVNAGKADLGLAGMTVTTDRLKEVDFSISYASGVQSVVVLKGSSIKTVDDLDGKHIGTQQGTTGDIYCSEQYGDKVTSYVTANEAISALIGGSVDAVVIDNEPAKAFVKKNANLVILDTEYANEDYAACIAKGNTQLLEAVNEAITELIADGTIDKIIAKYIH